MWKYIFGLFLQARSLQWGLSIELSIRETKIDHSLFIYPCLHNVGIPGVEDILYCNMIHPPSLLSIFQY
jgi:hypothetical protein